jgi:hypothetical protein
LLLLGAQEASSSIPKQNSGPKTLLILHYVELAREVIDALLAAKKHEVLVLSRTVNS